MQMKTAVADMFGVEYPILAFSHCRDVVAAVTNAGGFGVLGAVAHTPKQLEIDLTWIDEHVGGKPYGIDLLLPQKYEGADEGGLYRLPLRPLPPAKQQAFGAHLRLRESRAGSTGVRTGTTRGSPHPDTKQRRNP